MEFTEYEKMNTSMSNFEDKKEFDKTKWVVTEKIHGANFSFHSDGKSVNVARRRGLLEGEENFFNHKNAEFMETYPQKMKDVFLEICKIKPDEKIDQVSIYGELFGGVYVVEGKDLATTRQKPVQNEIQYCPEIKWCAFDISFRTSDAKQHEYVDFNDATNIFSKLQIFHLKPLFMGSIKDALNYEIGFDSVLPKIFKLPPLPQGSNKAEGIVVKPIRNIVAKTKSQFEERIIIKIKLPEFDEVRTHSNKTTNTAQKQKPKKMLQRILAYSTEERLTNAISKIGYPGSEKLEHDIREEFITDIFVDVFEYDGDVRAEWESSSEVEKDKVKEILKKKTMGLIKKYKNST